MDDNNQNEAIAIDIPERIVCVSSETFIKPIERERYKYNCICGALSFLVVSVVFIIIAVASTIIYNLYKEFGWMVSAVVLFPLSLFFMIIFCMHCFCKERSGQEFCCCDYE